MPWIEWRGKSCRVRWETGKVHPETGKKLLDSKSSTEWTEEEAYNYGLDRESDVRNDRYLSRRDGSVLMQEYCQTWPDTLDVGHLRDKAIRSMIRLHIVPRWGETAVGDIKPSAYRAWRKQLKALPNVGEKYGEEILTVFSMLMDDAVDDELRTSSPVPKAAKQKRGRYKKKKREKKREMRIEDVHQLACNALVFWGFPGYVFIWTMAMTGMRPGELYALRREFCHPAWPASDPDPDRREEALERYAGQDAMPAVRVHWQHQREHGQLKLFPPKYESHRDLVIPRFLAELLEMLLSSHDSEWVFLSIRGGLLANANFTYHYWRPIADGRAVHENFDRTRLGRKQMVRSRRPLPRIPATPYAGKRLYLVRHGHKEWIDEVGGGHARVVVESRMGHEVAGVEGLYSNVTTTMERRMMESLQMRWERFVVTLDPEWLPVPPTSLPVDLDEWVKAQVKAAKSPE
ncbi:integrase [Streptomyces sp. NPDC015032]|uniref:integrase n=1 Tax=Streptomyces sp. NPDC015032 TaxID=3364937 RepID=UPI0036F5D725